MALLPWHLGMRIDINAWLNVRIEAVCEGLGFTNTNKLTSEVRNRILRRPELWRDDVPWDEHGKIPTRSGLVDPLTGSLEPARPDHFCTWRAACDYDPAAKCPWWETMLADMFGDREPTEQAALIRVVQECIGAALIDKKSRSLSKALVFGVSRTSANRDRSTLSLACLAAPSALRSAPSRAPTD
jgi:phage/plasmid-associated DNA primase